VPSGIGFPPLLRIPTILTLSHIADQGAYTIFIWAAPILRIANLHKNPEGTDAKADPVFPFFGIIHGQAGLAIRTTEERIATDSAAAISVFPGSNKNEVFFKAGSILDTGNFLGAFFGIRSQLLYRLAKKPRCNTEGRFGIYG
jgi:hypothetical protein